MHKDYHCRLKNRLGFLKVTYKSRFNKSNNLLVLKRFKKIVYGNYLRNMNMQLYTNTIITSATCVCVGQWAIFPLGTSMLYLPMVGIEPTYIHRLAKGFQFFGIHCSNTIMVIIATSSLF